ncbi:MAG: hypothetical protein H6R16_2112 [Proteobacteria bacterium]|nr:hypothetical protein [Pseudomonadota bacterium]
MSRARLNILKFLLVLIAVLTTATANAGVFGFGGTSWKEEVLLHDGSKILVERHSSYGGRHELSQGAPIKEQSVTFSVPGGNQSIIWKSEFTEDVGRGNFDLLAVHILKGTPYIVAEPNLCLAFNKWGRPNPPYVFFKHDGKAWQRISMAEFPLEFKDLNVTIDIKDPDLFEALEHYKVLPASVIKKLNGSLTPSIYKTILREPIKQTGPVACGEMIRNGHGWSGLGPYMRQPSLGACLQFCNREKVAQQNCPCNRLFQTDTAQ